MSIISITSGVFVLLFITFVVVTMIKLRRVVPTNMVHIVQSSKQTVSYGKGKDNGNTYYAFPTWVPVLGVSVTEFPESIFQVALQDYEAYDQTRLPFIVDVVAFFRVEDANVAAQRVATFAELKGQLDSVLKGAVRRILATNPLEHIMEARSEFGEQFTKEVNSQIKEWGVTTVKTIEFMDIRDSKSAGSKVIHDIMAREQSRIDMISRQTVAENNQAAKTAEIDAQRTVAVREQDALQQVGIRTAEKEKVVGIAKEQANQEVQEQAKVTVEKDMAVLSVEQNRKAEIARQVAVTNAEAAKQVQLTNAEATSQSQIITANASSQSIARESEGRLQATQNAAKGIEAEGKARAAAEEAILLAPVTAQTTLAKEIGENQGYQTYLITLEQVRAGQAVGIEMAEAIKAAKIQIISSGGNDNMLKSASSIADMFTPAGGTKLSGMLAAMAQTPEGKALLEAGMDRLAGDAK